ncbi:MAG: tetratricopeptide repeat protein [Clostridiaceae bacterium]|nr:tetratricopeptide repeat protein [Clostridiaceae bacterium]
MQTGSKWQDLLENEQHLIQVLFADGPIPRFPGDSTSQSGRLYETLSVVRYLMRGEFEDAGSQIARISEGQNLFCHQLAAIWLQAEIDDSQLAYQKLNEWIKASRILARVRRSYRRLMVRPCAELDRRLALRWAPVLRLYLATLLTEWTPDILAQIKADRDEARHHHVSDQILARLETMQKIAEARQRHAVDEVVQAARDWHARCQAEPEYGQGGEYLLEAVLALEYDNRVDEALFWLDKALVMNPDQYELLLIRARLFKQGSDDARSMTACDDLIRKFPDDFAGYCLRSNAWFLQGDYDQAMADAEKACAIAPENPNSLIARAYVNMQLGRYADALKDFNQTLNHDPQAYDAMRGQGKCLSMLGRDFEALSCFNNLRRIYPEDPDIYYELADILFSSGYMDDCEKACRRCLQIDGSYANAYVILGMIATRRGEDDLALGLLERAVRLEPDNTFALNELAYALHLTGEDDRALDLTQQAIRETPDFADAWCNKGLILYYRSDFEESALAFNRALQLAPDHVTAWIGKGNTLTQLCDFEEAQACYDQALQLDPNSADACHGKALLYRMLGLEDDVRTWQERAMQLDPEIDDL